VVLKTQTHLKPKIQSKMNILILKIKLCLQEKDYTTHNFVQWYVSEQLEEEALARTMLDKLRLIGDNQGGMYLFDRDLENASQEKSPPTQQTGN
jgi:ferritin